MKTRFSSWMLMVATVFAVACDNMDDELDAGIMLEKARTVRLVTAADKSTLLDVKQMFRNVKGVDLASYGGSHVNYINDRFVHYSDVSARAVEFSFGVLHTNNARTEVDVILTRQDAAFTRASMTNKEVLVVNLLNNPELSMYNPLTKATISVEVNRPRDSAGILAIAASSIATVGNVALARYTPPSGFVGQVRFKYSVTVDVEGQNAACNFLDAPEFYSANDVVIEVTN